MNIDEHAEDLIVLCRFPSELEAAPIVAELKTNDIPVSLTGGFTAGFIAEAPGDVQVKILEKDRERAQEILKRFEIANHEIDWNQVDVGEPKED